MISIAKHTMRLKVCKRTNAYDIALHVNLQIQHFRENNIYIGIAPQS